MECVICIDSDPPPIQSGCACRGVAGLAHPACRARAAAAQEGTRGFDAWRECQTCRQPFTGTMARELAEAWCAHTSALAETSVERIAARSWLARALHSQGRREESDLLTLAAHESSRQALGDEHPSTLALAFNLAFLRLGTSCDDASVVDGAERIMREIRRAARSVEDEDERVYLGLLADTGIGACHLFRGAHEDAARVLGAAYAAQRRLLGSSHALTVSTEQHLAVARALGGDAPMVRELQERVRTEMRELGPDHPETLATRIFLARSMLAVAAAADEADEALEAFEAAERELRDVLCAYRRTAGDDHCETTGVLRMLVRLASEKRRMRRMRQA